MRNMFVLLAVLGAVGVVFGVLNIVGHATGPNGVPFSFENYGGPGPIIAGLLLVAVSLYLRSVWRERD